MYQEEAVTKFIKNYQDYRKMQRRLEKLKIKAENHPSPAHIKPMQALLAGLNNTRKEMDITAAQLQLMGKRAKQAKPVNVKGLIN